MVSICNGSSPVSVHLEQVEKGTLIDTNTLNASDKLSLAPANATDRPVSQRALISVWSQQFGLVPKRRRFPFDVPSPS